MDWTLAINRNREALGRLIAMLFATVGLGDDGLVAHLPRYVRLTVLRALRPAESAVRRLIFVWALTRGLEALPLRPRSFPAKPSTRKAASGRIPSFPLFDPRKRFASNALRRVAGPGPRILFLDGSDPVIEGPPEPSPDDLVSAERLSLRLRSLKRALETLPRQAQRLARMRARRAPLSPMRPGWPPGHRARGKDAIDEILSDCHALAMHALKPPI